MKRPVEAAWLDYAWHVVNPPASHLTTCAALGGVGMPSGTDARFPGFVGERYEDGGGVLCVGHVHRTRPDDADGDWALDIARVVDAWSTDGRSVDSDARFLSAIRGAYLDVIDGWEHWKRHFAPLLRAGRVPTEAVAFTNVAKCRTDTDEHGSQANKITTMCSEMFPPAELIAILRPAVILLASTTIELGDVGDAEVVQWHGRTRKDMSGNTVANWEPLVANRLRRLHLDER